MSVEMGQFSGSGFEISKTRFISLEICFSTVSCNLNFHILSGVWLGKKKGYLSLNRSKSATLPCPNSRSNRCIFRSVSNAFTSLSRLLSFAHEAKKTPHINTRSTRREKELVFCFIILKVGLNFMAQS